MNNPDVVSYDEPVITEGRLQAARNASDSGWSDREVIDAERDLVDVSTLVYAIVEGQFTHSSGEHSVYEVEESTAGLVGDHLSTMLPDALESVIGEKSLREVREDFGSELTSEARGRAIELYKTVRDDAEETETIEQLREVIEDELDLGEYGGEF